MTNLDSYDYYIVTFSGGKDSTAMLLHLLNNNIPKEKIELWHHDIDAGDHLMDWEVTSDYCRALGEAFGVPVYYSWKNGGFAGELFRDNVKTSPVSFQDMNYNIISVGGLGGKESTRRKFPQISADLSVRWCSSYMKVDVCRMAINNQERFQGKRTLIMSGERAEESPARSKYKIFEPDATDLRDGKKYQRHVDRWRPVKEWSENAIWDILEKYRVRVHPCYYLGWNRCSCKFCIFGNNNQFKSAATISPDQFGRIASMEEEFGVTIKRKEGLIKLIESGIAYPNVSDNYMVKLATSLEYTENIFTDNWTLPSGAFGENFGAY